MKHIVLTVLVVFFVVGAAVAQTPEMASADGRIVALPPLLQYSAKFVCGTPKAGTPYVWTAASGRYFTAVNVHNPSTWEAANFVKKFALGLPDERVGKISDFFKVSLKPDEVMLIDCGNIWKHLGLPANTFIEGYAVLQTRYELDVESVFTAANGPAYEVSTLHTERVAPRKLTPCPTNTTDISTGTTAWTLITDPSGTGSTPRPATPMVPNHPWAGTSGVQFVSYSAGGDASTLTPPKLWVYEKCFCACPDVKPVLNITKLMVDDQITLKLNGNTLGPAVTGIATAAQIAAINSAAAPFWTGGRNCLRAEVTDLQQVYVGFGLLGTIANTTNCP